MSYSDSVGFGTYGVQAKSTISSASSRSLFIGRLGKTAVFDLKADGSADFAGNIQILAVAFIINGANSRV